MKPCLPWLVDKIDHLNQITVILPEEGILMKPCLTWLVDKTNHFITVTVILRELRFKLRAHSNWSFFFPLCVCEFYFVVSHTCNIGEAE